MPRGAYLSGAGGRLQRFEIMVEMTEVRCSAPYASMPPSVVRAWGTQAWECLMVKVCNPPQAVVQVAASINS